MSLKRIRDLYLKAEQHMKNVNIGYFDGMDKPLFLVSETYPGVWMEHIYDSLFYAYLYPEGTEYIKNILELFIDHQKEDGQLPCSIFDKKRVAKGTSLFQYTQIQECVSFAGLCLEAYHLLKDKAFLQKCYTASAKWVSWLGKYRSVIPEHRGLIEMFVGFDTGHDNSARFSQMKCKNKYFIDSVAQNAAILPEGETVAPIVAVDMNCNYYANYIALSEMAEILGDSKTAKAFENKAKEIKQELFALCYDAEDAFFYDVDRNGNKRKYRSCAILHLFLEGVLDKKEDADIIAAIYERHIKNTDEFWTDYPFPSMAINDPSTAGHASMNCWGYYTQMLTALRCTRWMDRYGFGEDFEILCRKILDTWTLHYDRIKFGQELDPVTGVPTECSEWYSSCMLFYIYASRRLGEVKE